MDDFQVELLRRLPLAKAVLRGFGYVLDRATLNQVFARHRRRCYEDVLRFDQLVYLIRDALTVYQGSGHRAFVAARYQGDLPVAEQNVYGKLARLPEELSQALLAVGTVRLAPLLPPRGAGAEIPSSLAGWRPVAFDGKKLKNAAKRLKALRGLPGKLLGGKVLAALDVPAGLVLAMNADPDGERNDVPLVPELVSQVRQQVPEPILWLGDRQFGNLEIPELLTLRSGDHFLLRCPKSFKLAADPQRPAQVTHDADGRTVACEWGWIGTAGDSRRRYVRRITLPRAQEEAVVLITDLLDEEAVPAKDLLAMYRLRWDIERVFQQVTEVFHLRALIGSTPRAMIFQAAMCFLLYNLIQVIRAYVAADGGRPVAEVSSEKLFWEVRDQLATWAGLGEPELVLRTLAPPAAADTMGLWLAEVLRGSWRLTYVKSPPRRRKPPGPGRPPAKVPRGHGGHSSTWRILQAAKAAMLQGQRS